MPPIIATRWLSCGDVLVVPVGVVVARDVGHEEIHEIADGVEVVWVGSVTSLMRRVGEAIGSEIGFVVVGAMPFSAVSDSVFVRRSVDDDVGTIAGRVMVTMEIILEK
jgi:hypothetical protein